ncbi:MAG: T9SS type A sorting domain-containing protein [Ginsengibacter sp.]
MKKFYLLSLLLLSLNAIFAQNIIRIGTNSGSGSLATTPNTYGPFTTNTTVSWNRHAYIYPVSLLSGMPSNSRIDSIFFARVSLSGIYGALSGSVNCKIYLKNTTATDFGTGPLDWATEVSTTTLVYNNDPTSIIGNTAGFKKFILTTSFTYTGASLEVLVEYTQSAPATGEVVWGYDNDVSLPVYINNSIKYVSGTSGVPTTTLSNSNTRHPGLVIASSPLNPVDASVIDIITPNTSCYSSPQNTSVVVKNSGKAAIAAGAAAVTLKIAGANSSTTTQFNTGIIAPGSFEIIGIAGINLNNPGTNFDTAFVTLAGDAVAANDTAVTQSTTASLVTSFPAVEDVEGSLPVFSYASTVAITQAWTIENGNYSNVDLPSPLMPHGGSYFFLFDSYDADPGTISRLFSNCVKLTSGATNSLEFFMSHDDSYSTNLDSLYVTISADKGVTWTRIAGFQRYDPAFTSPEWSMESVDLSAYQGLTIQVGFEGVGDYGNVIGLDDITIISNGVTPVTLLSFNAKQNGSVNAISWTTAQELNSRYFAIEHSIDGVHFDQIGRVAAAGNSSSQHTYLFNDSHPVKGINYYRLRIVDIDNSAKYSLVKSVKNTGLANFSIYPSPAKNNLNISIEAESIDRAEISISDINGRIVHSGQTVLQPGSNTLPVDVSKFAAGTYFLKIQMNSSSIVRKFNKE